MDYKVKAGSSIRMIPIRFEVWDWDLSGNEFMASWKGIISDLMPDPVIKSKGPKVHGADGCAPPDGGDVVRPPERHTSRATLHCPEMTCF